MKNGKSRNEFTIIKVRVLVLIYLLLCILTVLFSRSFFIATLDEGRMPERLNLIVFFTIPSILIIVLLVSIFNLFIDFITRRPGSKFNARLMVYFIIIVIFSTTPAAIMTGTALNEVIRFWQSIDINTAKDAANVFIGESYLLHLERFERLLEENNYSFHGERLPDNIASIQTFRFTASEWIESSFSGDDSFTLPSPPSQESGFIARTLPRDAGIIRYVHRQASDEIQIINYKLEYDFDRGREAIENQNERFETINILRANIRPLLFYYYGVFFLPTLLMTLIIAISFTRRITHPIVELTEATRRVSEGDFSIQILTRRNDELGLLIRAFNAMVQDLEKSREALVKNEKISIWQNMAQQLAHEIKNPLTPIKLSAERVLRRLQNDPENIHEIIESSMMAIIQETESLSALLNEFRTLSKPAEPSKTWTSITDCINEIINTYSASFPDVKFEAAHIDTSMLIKIDKHRLNQILTNIIINAIDSMNGTGTIEIRTDLVKKREICYCRISVKDSGKGISKQEIKNVFTPYFTTKESGTGLGLPIVERIVNDHDGAIWFDSSENIGTTFYVDLPAVINQNNAEE